MLYTFPKFSIFGRKSSLAYNRHFASDNNCIQLSLAHPSYSVDGMRSINHTNHFAIGLGGHKEARNQTWGKTFL